MVALPTRAQPNFYFLTLNMAILEDVLREAGFSDKAIAEVKDGKLHYGGSLDAASDKELSVKLAFHVKAKLENAKDIFIGDPKKKVPMFSIVCFKVVFVVFQWLHQGYS